MTDQINLGLVWASGGGFTPVGDAKYTGGWVAEIPTFQNFNYMVKGLDQNILHFAEENSFDWEDNIAYQPGARVKGSDGKIYICKVATTGDNPTAGTNYWVQSILIGSDDYANLQTSEGLKIAYDARVGNTWVGQDQTLLNSIPMTVFNTTSATNNWGLANVGGAMCAINLGQVTSPDGRNLSIGSSTTHKLFHEGNLPNVSNVTGAVEEAPNDGSLYARVGIDATSGNWVKVTSVDVGATPPAASIGAGAGWYNLEDGQFYLDINDGDSSQWVQANPPVVPDQAADRTSYDDTATGLGEDVQVAIDTLFGKIGRKNLLINGGFNIWQRGTLGVLPGRGQYVSADRWTSANWSGTELLRSNSTNYLHVNIERDAPRSSMYIAQAIELDEDSISPFLPGQTMTLSYEMNPDVDTKALFSVFAANDWFNTNDEVFAYNASQDVLASGGWQKVTHTFTIPSWTGAGKDRVIVEVGGRDGATFAVGQRNRVRNVQLEVGAQATAFEYRPIGEELELCKRYYSTLVVFDGSAAYNTPGSSGNWQLAQTVGHSMRAVPSVTVLGNGSGVWAVRGNAESFTAYQGTESSGSSSWRQLNLDAEL